MKIAKTVYKYFIKKNNILFTRRCKAVLAPGPVAGWESAPPLQTALRAAPCPYTPPATKHGGQNKHRPEITNDELKFNL